MAKTNPSPAADFLRTRLSGIDVVGREKEIYAVYISLRTFESDFDKAQGTLRTIASAWLLTAVTGIGLIIQNEFAANSDLAAPAASAIRQGLLIIAAAGVTSLWYVDQRIYQRLLHGAFSVGCWMEHVYPQFLPPIRSYLFRMNNDLSDQMGLFYKGPIIMFAFAGLFNLVLAYLYSGWSDTGLGLFMLHVVLSIGIFIRSRSWSDLATELPPTGDPVTPTPAPPSASPPAA